MRTQNVKLSLVPQRSCAFEAYLLGKIKLMMTMDPRQNGEVLMQKVRDMLPRATKMITNEIAHSPDDVGLVIKELTTMNMEAVLNNDGCARDQNPSAPPGQSEHLPHYFLT